MKDGLILNPEKYLPGYQEFAITARASVESITATGAFKGAYTGQTNLLKSMLSQGGVVAKDITKLNKEIEKVLADGTVSFHEYLSLARSEHGGSEFSTAALGKIADQTAAGISAATDALDTSEIQEKIQKGIKIDIKESAAAIKAQFDELAIHTMNDFSDNPMSAESPSPAFGIPIMKGIISGFEYLNNPESLEKVKGALSQFNGNISNYIEGQEENAVLSSLLGGQSTVEIKNSGLVELLQTLSSTTILEAQSFQKTNQEKTDALIKLMETFMSGFKAYLDNPKVIENKIEIDGKSLATQLMKIKTDSGVGFSLVSPGGDSL